MRRKRPPALFSGFWLSPDGERQRRATRAELIEARRLWLRHVDIRTGRVRA